MIFVLIPHGPKPINKNRQIAIPTELMNRVGLEVGDQIYLAPHEAMQGAIVLLPIELVTKWIDAGRRALFSDGSEAGASADDSIEHVFDDREGV